MTFSTGTGLPQRRMGLLSGVGNDLPRRHLEVATFPRESFVHPHLREHLQCFFPARPRFLGRDTKSTQFDVCSRTAGAHIHPAIAEEVEHGYALSYPDGMIVRKGQQHYAVTNLDALSTLTDRAIQHLWR